MDLTSATHHVSHQFVDTDPATEVIAFDLNQWMNEIVNAIIASGQTPDSAVVIQLAKAIGILGGGNALKTVSCKLFKGANSSSAFDVTYFRHSLRKINSIHVPFCQVTIPAGTDSTGVITLTIAAGGVLSDEVLSAYDDNPTPFTSQKFIIYGTVNGTQTDLILYFFDGTISISKKAGGVFTAADVVAIHPFDITYFGKSI